MVLLRGSAWPQQRWRPDLDGQTYRINRGRRVPTSDGRKTTYVTHPDFWREARCEEVKCDAHIKGFTVTLSMSPEQDPEDLAMMRARYNYIRDKSGRGFIETWSGSTVAFHFHTEQQCFKEHKLPVERDPLFYHLTGRDRSRPMDYDQFFDTFNETSYLLQRRGDRHG